MDDHSLLRTWTSYHPFQLALDWTCSIGWSVRPLVLENEGRISAQISCLTAALRNLLVCWKTKIMETGIIGFLFLTLQRQYSWTTNSAMCVFVFCYNVIYNLLLFWVPWNLSLSYETSLCLHFIMTWQSNFPQSFHQIGCRFVLELENSRWATESLGFSLPVILSPVRSAKLLNSVRILQVVSVRHV